MPRWGTGKRPAPKTTPTVIAEAQPPRFVYAPHFYDLNVLFFKAYHGMSVNVQGLSRGLFLPFALYFGTGGLLRNYCHQLKQLVRRGYATLGDVPVLIGEVGIPYDVNDTLRAQPGDYRVQHTLLSALISGLERNLVSFTLWNYNPANTLAAGDGWNLEDFSIVNFEASAADRANMRASEPLYRGGRALGAILRPYACKVAGLPLRTAWDEARQTLHFRWKNGTVSCYAPTEIYVPDYLFRGIKPRIVLSDGRYEYVPEEQTLRVYHDVHTPHATHQLLLSGNAQRVQGIEKIMLCALLAGLVAYAVASAPRFVG